MNLACRRGVVAVLVVLAGWLFGHVTGRAGGAVMFAQQTQTPQPGSAQSKPKPAAERPVDKYDRQWTLMESQRAGFQSGWQRGQELYYMKCWFCHNEYTILSDRTGSPAPSLRDIAKRMNAREITARILNGSFRMPAYKQMTETDLNDLVTYLLEKCGTFKTGGGCFDEHNPPPNPLFRAGHEPAAAAK
jgi:hypothetical protein